MNLLFMCVANSARSQLAEGLAREVFGPENEVRSAGSHPGKLNPLAVEAMKQVGIDISHHWSKSIEDLPSSFLAKLDYVITLCAEEVCPVLISNAKKLHWPLPDPAGAEGSAEVQLRRFAETRDAIQKRLLEFQATLNAKSRS